jgi:hypothetical protein
MGGHDLRIATHAIHSIITDCLDCTRFVAQNRWLLGRNHLQYQLSLCDQLFSEMADTWKWTSESKLCFVTTGATAPFTALIESILSAASLNALCADSYTHLLVQYGTAKDVFDKSLAAARSHLEAVGKKSSLIIEGIDFESGGLQAQFKLVQQSKGLVVSHAGA